jgi:hypothetical protein
MSTAGHRSGVFHIALLAFLLFAAQMGLAGHGIEHAFHAEDEACIECLALPGFAAVPAQPPQQPLAAKHTKALGSAVPSAPTLALHLAFHGRAPPRLHD